MVVVVVIAAVALVTELLWWAIDHISLVKTLSLRWQSQKSDSLWSYYTMDIHLCPYVFNLWIFLQYCVSLFFPPKLKKKKVGFRMLRSQQIALLSSACESGQWESDYFDLRKLHSFLTWHSPLMQDTKTKFSCCFKCPNSGNSVGILIRKKLSTASVRAIHQRFT